MKTPSGILHVVDFKTSQIVSNIQPKDYWDDKRHWEIKNNIDTLEFRVFDNTDHAATLMQQNLVLKEVRDGRIVPYVITETEKIQTIDPLLLMHLVNGFNLRKLALLIRRRLKVEQSMNLSIWLLWVRSGKEEKPNTLASTR